MRIDILTVVPELLVSPLNESILKRAQRKGLVEIEIHNLRDYTFDKYRQVDDYPFGGEAGMVMKPEPISVVLSSFRPNATTAKSSTHHPTGSNTTNTKPTGSQPWTISLSLRTL